MTTMMEHHRISLCKRLGLTVVEKNIDSFPKVFNVSFDVYLVYVIGTLLTTDACDDYDGASQNLILQ